MQFLKDICKGAVIGIANIIPGVSGGTMMVSMGIYDRLIHCITHLFKEFKASLRFLLPIVIGAAIALVASSFGLEYLSNAYPVPANLLFIGLILGCLPAITKNVKGNKLKIGYGAVFLLFLVLVVCLALIGGTEGNNADLSLNVFTALKMFGVGIIASATMVIPGVSGSMILLLLGYYHPVLESINAFIRALTAFDVDGLLTGCGVLVPFGLGVVFGIFAIAKLIEIIFAKFPIYAYWAIIGLIVASPFAIVWTMIHQSNFPGVTVLSVIVSVVTFVAGFFIAMKLGE